MDLSEIITKNSKSFVKFMAKTILMV